MTDPKASLKNDRDHAADAGRPARGGPVLGQAGDVDRREETCLLAWSRTSAAESIAAPPQAEALPITDRGPRP
jgi:hypothetical protein